MEHYQKIVVVISIMLKLIKQREFMVSGQWRFKQGGFNLFAVLPHVFGAILQIIIKLALRFGVTKSQKDIILNSVSEF